MIVAVSAVTPVFKFGISKVPSTFKVAPTGIVSVPFDSMVKVGKRPLLIVSRFACFGCLVVATSTATCTPPSVIFFIRSRKYEILGRSFIQEVSSTEHKPTSTSFSSSSMTLDLYCSCGIV